jgi:hypothetical protein
MSKSSTDISNAYFDNYILKDKLSYQHQDGEIIDTEYGEGNKAKTNKKERKKKQVNIKKKGRSLKAF